jgi:putative copper export protein
MAMSALDALRLSLHVLAASVWVGGQLVLGGLVPVARRAGRELTRAMARRFGQMAWPAYVVLALTGIWNLFAVHWSTQSATWQAVLWAKIGIVLGAGIFALAHQKARSPKAIGVFGALAGVCSTGALVMGVLLAG